MRCTRMLACAAVVGLTLAGGCRQEKKLPAAPQLDGRESVEYLAKQDAQLKSVTGEGSVTLTRADGESVRLDTVVVAEFPDRVRLRAWKMGHAVFDMTLTPDGVWMLVADPSRRDRIMPAGASAAQFMRGWSMLHGGFYSDPGLKVTEASGDTLLLDRPTAEGQTIRAVVDRRTLAVVRHMVVDEKGEARFILEYERHRVIDGVLWPMRLRAAGDQGKIQVDLDEVQLNVPPAPAAFVPPKRAEKLK